MESRGADIAIAHDGDADRMLALAPDESVTQVLRIRGQVTPIGDISPETVEAVATQQAGHEGQVMHGGAASRSITQSGVPGMRGVGAPVPAGLAEQQRAARAELGLDEDTDAARIESGESQK